MAISTSIPIIYFYFIVTLVVAYTGIPGEFRRITKLAKLYISNNMVCVLCEKIQMVSHGSRNLCLCHHNTMNSSF
jgi:hypothetical protein